MHKIRKYSLLPILLASLLLSACAKDNIEPSTAAVFEPTTAGIEIETSTAAPPVESSPIINTVDWSEYFLGLTGTAVIYIPDKNQYTIYNEDLSKVRRSPCSTFKIISSLIGLENGVIGSEDSVREWSKEVFWNDKWNRDIGFKDAFASSCIWYFREVINELGADVIGEELNQLNYGNCDISDWEGRLNNNNNNRALTGFWVESSLKISPLEQTEVMERIFNDNSSYSESTLNQLREAMLLTDLDKNDIKIFGKTGMGKVSGITVDAWFTGFAEIEDETIYFCIYLGESKGMEATSARAREIAVNILTDNFSDRR